ncbi:MAG TPA: TonB-dependent receptor [Solimonas sp.]
MSRGIALSLAMMVSALPLTAGAQEQGAGSESIDDALDIIATEPAPAEAAATAAPAAATAPEAAAAPAPRAPKSRLVEEIVVTAQKREENIQDVPISISAFSAETLDAKGIGDPKSLAQSIPGVTYGETVNFSIIYVRGVGTDAFLPDSDLSVAMYMDGIYFPFANGLSQTFGAIERVEVLKGPQGTLFGRNATGGAFNITTKSPTFDEPHFSFSQGYSEFDTFNTKVYGNIPISDTLAANVSLTYNTGDNYYSGRRGDVNSLTGIPLPKETEKGARVRLRWNPSDWLDLTVTGLKHNKEGLASSAMPNIEPSLLTRTLGGLLGKSTERPDPYKVFVDVPSYFSLDNEVVYGQLELKPDWFNIKVLASQQNIVTDNNYDFDGTEVPFITFDAKGQFADVFTAELQFLSNGEWGPDWLEWVGGIYYLDQTVGFPLNRLSVADLDLSTGSLLGLVQIPPGLSNLLNRIAGLGLPIPDGLSLSLVSLQKAEATAYFGQTTAHLNDNWYLTLGGRFQEERREVIESSVGTANLGGGSTQLLPLGSPVNEDKNFSPKAVLGYKFDGGMYYGSWSKGFKSGTFNTVNVYTAPDFVEPEEVTSYELGAKLELVEGQLRANGALFKTNIKNQQVQFISLLAGGAVQLENAGEVDIQGAEIELQYSPEWNSGMFVALGGTWLDATYASYPRASGYSQLPGPDGRPTGLYNFATGDYTGNRTVRTPEWAGTFSINQLFDLSHGDLEVGGTLFYSGDFYFQAQNTPTSRQPSYITVDAQVSYLHRASNVRLTLMGRNLTDEQYALTQFHTDAGVQEFLAPPRAFGVRFDWSF